VNVPSLHNDMTEIIRSALLPQRFPIRRDVELSAGVRSRDGVVSFYDHMWLGRQMLAVAAVQIRGTGLEAVLDAASFRQLLRAALAVLDDPEAVLSACREISTQVNFDAALVRFDTSSGAVASATAGGGRVEMFTCDGESRRLSAGDVVWIAVGDAPLPASADIPVEGLGQLVDGAIERGAGGCAAALFFRSQDRLSRTATLVVPNDLHAIPRVLGQISAFFSQHSIAEDDIEGIDVAIDEILTNAIGYAFTDGRAHEIYIHLAAEAGELIIEVHDDGAPFDPLGAPPPDLSDDIELRQIGGLGIHFVSTVMDKMEYRRTAGWNVLTLRKHLRQVAQSQEFES
jgi:anti-sigma regulatory factor (Ser/Thr protein kinase)